MRSLRPCSDSSATPSFPSQPEGKIGPQRPAGSTHSSGPRCEAPPAWTESPGGAGSGITWVSRPPPLPRSFSRSWSCEDAFPGLRPELDGYPIPAGSRAKLPPDFCLTGELEVFIFCSDDRKHVKFIKGYFQGIQTLFLSPVPAKFHHWVLLGI